MVGQPVSSNVVLKPLLFRIAEVTRPADCRKAQWVRNALSHALGKTGEVVCRTRVYYQERCAGCVFEAGITADSLGRPAVRYGDFIIPVSQDQRSLSCLSKKYNERHDHG